MIQLKELVGKRVCLRRSDTFLGAVTPSNPEGRIDPWTKGTLRVDDKDGFCFVEFDDVDAPENVPCGIGFLQSYNDCLLLAD